MKKFAIALIAITATPAYAGEMSVDIRCFSDSKNKIQLEFRTYTDEDIGWVGGQVRYRQSKEFIPLVFSGSKTLTEIKDRPWEFEHIWLEVVGGTINGEYRLISQGANVYGFSYTNRKTGKTIQLSEQSYIDESGKCTWA